MRVHRREGFTLFELMIVILIIAILVAIAIPIYLATQENAKKRTCQANLRTIDGAISQYHAEVEQYPPSIAALANYLKKTTYTCPKGGTTGLRMCSWQETPMLHVEAQPVTPIDALHAV